MEPLKLVLLLKDFFVPIRLAKLLSSRYVRNLVSGVVTGILLAFVSSIISPLALADDFCCFDTAECANKSLSSSTDCLNSRDYQVTSHEGTNSNVTVLSFHGGKIEPHTSEISSKLAEIYGWNRYDLNGDGTRACLGEKTNFARLHITSTNFDDPKALNLVRAHPKSVAIHGYRRRDYEKGTICVGGGNGSQVAKFIKYVNQHKVDLLLSNTGYQLTPVNATNRSKREEVCGKLQGTDPENIVNKNSRSMGGLQLELSPEMRRDLAKVDEAQFNDLRDVIYGAVAEAMVD